MSSNPKKKPSLVVSGPDKYSNPFSYSGEREKNYVEVEVAEGSQEDAGSV